MALPQKSSPDDVLAAKPGEGDPELEEARRLPALVRSQEFLLQS